jgi:hypothetical protein
MRGHVHKLRLIGSRIASGPDTGRPVRDAEGRVTRSPTDPPVDLNVREVVGFIGVPSRNEVPLGEDIVSAAQLPKGTVVFRGDELEAYDTGDPNLDGRYKIDGVQSGRAMVRVLLKRTTT